MTRSSLGGKHLRIAAFVSAASLFASAQSPRIALLLSGDGRHGDEFAGALNALGWTVDRYPCTADNLRTLTDKLRTYDMLLSAPLFNAQNSTLLPGADRQAYKRFLEDGGLIAVTDGSYPGVRDWLADIDRAFGGLESGTCNSSQWAINGITTDPDPPHPLRFFPSRIHEPNSWPHFLKLPQGSPWRVVAACSEGFPVTVAQTVGKGLVSLSALRQPSAAQLGNFYACLQLRRAGIALTSFELTPPAVGSGRLALAFAENGAPKTCGFVYEVVADGGQTQRWEKAASGANLELPFHISLRGPVSTRLFFKRDGRETLLFARKAVLPPLLSIAPAASRGILSTARRLPTVGFDICLAPDRERLDGAMLRLAVADAAGKYIAETNAALTNEAHALRLPLAFASPLPAGSYTARAVLSNEARSLAEAETVFKIVAPEPAQTLVDEDNTLLVGGNPFFPLGFYHVDPTNYAEVAALGINTVQYWTWHDRRGLDLAAAHGLKAIFELNHKSAQIARDAVAKFASHPALLMWYGLDEPAEGSYGMAETLRDAYHASDDRHPVYSVSCRPDIFEEQAAFADVFAHDPYGKPQRAAEWMTRATAAVRNRKPVLCVLGTFGQETDDELRAAAYLALAHDARGILWYPWHQMGGGPLGVGLKKSPAQQAVIKQLCSEIAALAPALTAPARRPFVSEDGKLHGLYADCPAKRYLLLVNSTSDKIESEAIIPTAEKVSQSFRDLFKRGSDVLAVTSGRFRIALAPQETRAYATE
ncbi:MAG TPA: hypothetical protein PKM57_17500 [Kiritimatiellia bacterium]|nr:hypothetical protein [Kiritimatiellia bacterium]